MKLSSKAKILPALIVCSLTQIRCGSGDSSLFSADERVYRQPTVVVMGGNETCQPGKNGNTYEPRSIAMHAEAKTILNSLKAEFKVENRMITSCYDSTSTIYYAIDDEAEVREGDRSDFKRDVMDSINDNSLVVFIGHSYGGWLSMKLAHDLAKEEQKIAGLFTIDPISRVDCSFSRPFGCQSAPKDITAPERKQINLLSEAWMNYFQAKTIYLRSSAIKEADKNEQVNASHYTINQATGVWTEINEQIRKLL